MARDTGSVRPEDDPSSARPAASGEPDGFDGRMLELDAEEESPFLRAQKRVPVRRGPLPRKAAHRLKYAVVGIIVVGFAGAVFALLYRYGASSWRFRLDSSDQIEIGGIEHVTRTQVMDILGGDIGRNVFFIPLDERKRQLEEIPWVENAAVMRLLPNRVKVRIVERTPVAWVQVGSRVALIDRDGVVMDPPSGSRRKYSFPVIVGGGDQEPLSTRAARMKIYDGLIRELDSEGGHYSQDISEVDLSDEKDAKVTVADPAGEVLVHLGSERFLERYKLFVAHLQEWRQQYQLKSVDLRYERQVIVNPDGAAQIAQPKPRASAPLPAAANRKPPPRKKSR